jgi:hypothetical protein
MWHCIAVLEVLNVLKYCIDLKSLENFNESVVKEFDSLTNEDEGNLVLFNIRNH